MSVLRFLHNVFYPITGISVEELFKQDDATIEKVVSVALLHHRQRISDDEAINLLKIVWN